jgi:UDP-glucose 4-epimerase
LRNLPGVTLLQGTLSDTDLLCSQVAHAQGVISIAHAGASTPQQRVVNDMLPVLHMLQSAPPKTFFIYTSSTSALGDLSGSMSEQRVCLPNAWWGANKAATEKFVLAAGVETSVRCMIVRPSLTFGAAVLDGAPTETFSRFRDIAFAARDNRDIVLAPGDGTQMTDAADVAAVFEACVARGCNRTVYHAVCSQRTLWEEYAHAAIALCGSTSRVVVDRCRPESFDCVYETTSLQEDLGLQCEPWPALQRHIEWILR